MNRRSPHSRAGRRRGLTLMELLVVISIIGLLLSLMLPTVQAVRDRAKGVRCMVNMRTVVFDFQLFADEFSPGERGDSDRRTDNRFEMEDFVESQYSIAEFWSGPKSAPQTLSKSRESLMCPAVKGGLTRAPNKPCTTGAITPYENVGSGFNARLHRQAGLFRNRLVMVPSLLSAKVLEHPYVPVVFDVDGEQAEANGRQPYFSAPPGPVDGDVYADGKYWFPALRHSGQATVGFVGGHVLQSKDPAGESAWDWAYQPEPLRNLPQ